MKWTELAKHGNFVSDVSKMNKEKLAVITTDQEMDNAVSIRSNRQKWPVLVNLAVIF